MTGTRRTAVLISGTGSNLQALIDAGRNDAGFPAKIALVVSNRPGVAGLDRATDAGIETVVIPHRDYPDRESYDAEIDRTLRAHDIEFVCLAGFMRILSAAFVADWEGRMLNIHPSLLPSFRGHDAHRQVLESTACLSGCTVHAVTAELDGGPIVAQAAIRRGADDDESTLAARVRAAEHLLYPLAVRSFLRDADPSPRVPEPDGMLIGLNPRVQYRP